MDVRDRRTEEGLRADRGPAGQLRRERRRLRRPRQPDSPLALRLPVLTRFSAVTIPDFSGISLRTFPAFNSGLFRRKASHAAFAEAAEFVLTQRARSPAHGLTPHAPPGCWFSCGSRALREDLSSIDSLLPGAARRGETAPLSEVREGCECQSLSRNAEKAHLPIRRPWPSSWQRGCPVWRSRG